MKGGKYAARKPRSGRILWLIPIFALVVSSILPGDTAAKYTTGFESNYQQADANEFYFTSDLLSEAGSTYSQVCAELQKATISFELYNYQDELNCSDSTITYSVQYKLRTQSVYTDYSTNQTIQGGSKKTVPISVPISGLNPTGSETIVDIQVVSTAPYTKTLTASFIIIESVGTSSMTVSDSAGSNAVTVYVTTGDVGGTLSIIPPSDCIAEPASALNNNSMQVNPNAAYAFVFLKKGPSKNYTNTDFQYTLN